MGPKQTSYTQNFNDFPLKDTVTWKSGSYYLPGWVVFRTKSDSTLVPNAGNSNTGALYNYGSVGSTDRALGSISSTKGGQFTYNLLLQNSTGSTIKGIDLSYVGEQWRISNSTAGQHVISFWYAISSDANAFNTSPSSDKGWTEVPELTFYGPKFYTKGGALDGNAPDNRALQQALLQLEVPNGYYLMLRWKDADELEADHGLAIDDVNLQWHIQAVEMPAPLPVELAFFRAAVSGDQVKLKWQTASEEQNSYFEVQRSQNGSAFESIGRVAGHGTTVLTNDYSYIDERPLDGASYYRLKQVDEDDSHTFSAVVAVRYKAVQEMKVFPTIATDEVHVAASVGLQQALVLDMTGKVLLQQELSQNLPLHTLDIRRLNSGNYILVLIDAFGRRYTRKFIKQ
ncbi:T9SS type A sorting domain-containing protein [Pontibacter mangrovi]|nr:T9SS type A sorting domain-containing protein [Pontibacter mangrovi]